MDIEKMSIVELGAHFLGKRRPGETSGETYDVEAYDDELVSTNNSGYNAWGEYRGPECILVEGNKHLRARHHIGDMIESGRSDWIINDSSDK